jgi:23S rRNA (guanosine2251-2'-O)-methyltransferase
MNLICGINPVIEALTAGTRHFDRLLVVKGLRSRRLSEAIGRATRLGIPLRFEMRDTLDRLSDGVPHQGLIAVVSAKPVLSLEELLETVSDPALLVALDGVEDPRNLGAILRSVEAAGADGALIPERHSAGLSEVVGRSSAGALEHVDVARVGNLVQAIETLKSRGIWVVGFDASGTERWDAVDLTGSVCLVLGGEGRGIRRLVRDHCDHLVSIPHFGHVSSLNVSVAAGIALYEVVRQRGAVPSAVRPIPRPTPAEETRVVGPHPDDSESDPGAAPVLPNGESFGDELPEEDGHGPETLSPHVDLHGEDVAWGQGPTVLKPVNSRRGRRPLVRRHKSGARRPAVEGGPPKSEGARREPKARTGKARDAKSRDAKDHDQPEGVVAVGEAPEKQDAKSEEGSGVKKSRRRRRHKRSGSGSGDVKTAGPKPSSGPPPESPSDDGSAGAPPASEGGGKPPSSPGRRRGRRRRQ